jgi:hypothetical protein
MFSRNTFSSAAAVLILIVVIPVALVKGCEVSLERRDADLKQQAQQRDQEALEKATRETSQSPQLSIKNWKYAVFDEKENKVKSIRFDDYKWADFLIVFDEPVDADRVASGAADDDPDIIATLRVRSDLAGAEYFTIMSAASVPVKECLAKANDIVNNYIESGADLDPDYGFWDWD